MISTPEGIAVWRRPGDIAPEVGHRVTLDMDQWGQIPCRVTEAVPGTVLAGDFGPFTLRWHPEVAP